MEPTPQQVEKDVFIGSRQTPPPELEVPSHRDGLLEDLVVLGNILSRTGIFHVLFTFILLH